MFLFLKKTQNGFGRHTVNSNFLICQRDKFPFPENGIKKSLIIYNKYDKSQFKMAPGAT